MNQHVRPERSLNDMNPYLHGLYAPVREETTAERLPVIGEIPKDLYGAYFRNGPNPMTPPKGMHHWFDGDGMIHGIWFENGTARYANRYVRTADFEAERQGAEVMPGIFSPARPVEGRSTVYKDTANTDLVFHGGRLLALWYISGQPVAVDAATLETVGAETFGGKLPRNVSAHSKVDPATGEFVFFDYALYEPKMQLGVASRERVLTHYQEIDLPGPRLPHDMGLTENYAILHDLPVVFTEQALRNRMWQIHVADQPTRFGVVPRKGGAPKWFEFPSCYIYHVINAWEEGDEVVMAACKMVDSGFAPDVASHGPYAPMVSVLALRAQPFLWRMNMATGCGREAQIDDRLSEFPVINGQYTAQKSTFSYHVVMDDHVEQRFSGLLKYVLTTGDAIAHEFPKGVYGSEPVFAPREGAKAEDDGYVVTFVTDAAANQSEAHVIDARNFSAPPLARVKLPQRVPAGFHGVWAPGAEIGQG
ncbi:MAG: carotenoid oxygenase family protein [Pseudomonadota bacterium]|nr:carotenoid oxygenase family protein [Pseudomonadota bacterium]